MYPVIVKELILEWVVVEEDNEEADIVGVIVIVMTIVIHIRIRIRKNSEVESDYRV